MGAVLIYASGSLMAPQQGRLGFFEFPKGRLVRLPASSALNARGKSPGAVRPMQLASRGAPSACFVVRFGMFNSEGANSGHQSIYTPSDSSDKWFT
jgi:hypothetical protein